MPYLVDLITMMGQMIIQMSQYSPQIYLSSPPHWLVCFHEQQHYQPLMTGPKHISYDSLNYSSDGQQRILSNKKDSYSGTEINWLLWTIPP
jgi:hypothetical protein